MKSNIDIAKEVISGKWGNNGERKKALIEAGYNYNDIQEIVNALLSGKEMKENSDISSFKISGTEIMDIDVDLTKYKGISLNFKV